jgi:hypothetical protein
MNLLAARKTALTVALLLVLAVVWVTGAEAKPKSGPFSETANLHEVSKNGASFVERGAATGTYAGTLTLYLTTTPNGVTFRLRGANRNGSLVGSGAATITSHGKIGTINGKAKITGGAGPFANAHGQGLAVTGKFNRETNALQLAISGELNF